jgi:hypothetical protein
VDDLGEAAGLRLSHDEMFNIEVELRFKLLELEQNVRGENEEINLPFMLLSL